MKQIPIGKVASVRSGFAFKSKDWLEAGIPVIKIGNVKAGWVVLEGCSFVDEEVARMASDFELNPGDILISMTGHIGEVAKVRSEGRMLLNQRVGKFRIHDQNTLNQDYLYYCLQDKDLKKAMCAHAYGAAQPNISSSLIEQQKIPLPTLLEQKRIAEILSAYDQLIENSQRRIKILETMARNLYREWFVHFRFPGHENSPLIPSPLGDIPKGWEVKKLGEIVEFKSGFAFKSGTFTADGEHRLITIKNVQDGAFNPVSESRMNELPERLPEYCILKDGDILLSLTGNVGRVCLVYDGPFLLNQRVSKLAPIEAFDWALTYCMFRESDMRTKLEQLSNGVAQQNLSPIMAAKMEFALPPRALREQFSIRATPMIQRVIQLYSQIQNLRKTRDLLLPRLLSGQIPHHTPTAEAA